ncbi:MAG TPA: three-Cys-motif partner protein TcmP [Acidobacteria bacterium]|nr:three-Cys-motif partner protein TcmP [Acidobacteriota bacterium]
MAVPESTVWDRDPHTEAKHRVLRGYFDAWYPIMLSRFPRLTVLEGYAGPGVYSRGEDGSPVIALRALLERPELLDGHRTVRYVFIEQRADRLQKLQETIHKEFPQLLEGVTVDFFHGPCEDIWETALNRADAWGNPIFANLDPFGPGVPYRLVQRLGRNPSSEVLVTFVSDWLRRFWSLEELKDGDVQFGSTAWRAVGDLDDPKDKELFLVDEYRRALGRAGFTFSAPFRLSDEGDHSFYLVFGTRHRRGLERMKDSMWKTDPVKGIQFRDPRDPNQGILDLGVLDPDISPLLRLLTDKLRRHPQGLRVEELKDFALFNTGYRPPHVTKALQRLIERGQVDRTPSKGRLTKTVQVTLRQ